MPRIGGRREAREPGLNPSMKTRHTSKCSLPCFGVSEVNQTRDVKRDWLGETCVPMQVRTGKDPAFALWWVKAHAVDRRPQITSSPNLRKSFMNACRSAVFRQRRMMEELSHNSVS